MTEYDAILSLIFEELRKAEMKWAGWPDDMIHAAAIVAEEAGELCQAALDSVYSRGSIDNMRIEAAQVAAMGIRFLINLEDT